MSSVFVFLFALTFVVHAAVQVDESPATYLFKPPVGQHERPAYEWIKKQIRERTLTRPEEILEFFVQTANSLAKVQDLSDKYQTIASSDLIASERRQQISSRMKHIIEDEKVDSYRGDILIFFDIIHELILLADGGQSACNDETTDYFIKIVRHVYGDRLDFISRSEPPLFDTGLFVYLQHFGKTKFAACSDQFDDLYSRLIKRLEAGDVERAMDELVASQSKQNTCSKLNDQQLADLASEISFVEGKFEAKKLLKVSKMQFGEHSDPIKSKSTALSKFLARNCSSFLEASKGLLNLFNMIRLVSSTSVPTHTQRLLKLNQYGRLCKQLEESFDQVRRNIKSGLTNKLVQQARSLVICH